jgi:hypothetical protein
LGETRTIEKINGGNNSTNLEKTYLDTRPSTSIEGWNTT